MKKYNVIVVFNKDLTKTLMCKRTKEPYKNMYNLVGGALWVAVFCYAGYFFGDLPFVQENLKLLIVAIIFISVLPAIIEVVRAKLKS